MAVAGIRFTVRAQGAPITVAPDGSPRSGGAEPPNVATNMTGTADQTNHLLSSTAS
jgi:hypothetical protein